MAATLKGRLVKGPLDKWSTREQLALACSVKRSGDQNWVSVSRTVKMFAEQDRPNEWFSQRNCALQYADLLEKVETPKRKRGEKTETPVNSEAPSDQIMRKLTIERIEQLKQMVTESQQRYKQLKRDIETVRSGQLDDNLEELWERMENDRKAREAKAEAERLALEAANAEVQSATLGVAKGTPVVKGVKKAKLGSQAGDDETSQDSVISEDNTLEQQPIDDEQGKDISTIHSTPAGEDQSPGGANVVEREEKQDETVQTDGGQRRATDEVTAPVVVKSETSLPASPSTGAPTITALLHSCPAGQTKGPAIQEAMAKALASSGVSKPSLSTPGEPDQQFPSTDKVETEKQDTEAEAADIGNEDEVSFKQEEAPPSPASSVSSRVSEGSKVNKRRSSKGKAQRVGSRRSSRRRTGGDDDKQSSRAESSDEGGDEIDETSALNTSKAHSVFNESIPNSPASMSQCSDTEEEKNFKIWKKSIMLVYRAAANHKFANIFMHSVTDDIAPGYSSVVFRPMDLSTIKKNIETGVMRTTQEFQRDMMLMFCNAIMYNSSDQQVYSMACHMYDDVMRSIEEYVNTQLLVQSSESKNLRTSRRSEASDKEDDVKRRRISSEQVETSGGKTKRRKLRTDES